MLGKIESNISIAAPRETTPTFRPRKNSLRRPLSVKQPRDLKPIFLFTGLFVFLVTTLVLVTVIQPGAIPDMSHYTIGIS